MAGCCGPGHRARGFHLERTRATEDSMRFAEPWFLYALPAVWLVLGVAWWLSRRRRQVLLRRFVGQEAGAWADTGHCAKRRAFEAVSGLVAVSALIVTLARPLYFEFN